jgi:hypothetical protein
MCKNWVKEPHSNKQWWSVNSEQKLLTILNRKEAHSIWTFLLQSIQLPVHDQSLKEYVYELHMDYNTLTATEQMTEYTSIVTKNQEDRSTYNLWVCMATYGVYHSLTQSV